MIKSGNILKMRTLLKPEVEYRLPVGNEEILMNDLVGKSIRMKFLGQINCIHCGKKTKTSFSQGYCYSCFNTLPQTDISIVHPELDQSHLGISRDMEWAKENSLKPHFVYLALSSVVKVGVTRFSQIPTRWIDQGASRAIRLAQTPNRHIAGVMEVALKEHFADKTNWRDMLKNNVDESADLVAQKRRAVELLHPELKQYVTDDDEVVEVNYPVQNYPQKVTSINFDKLQEYQGVLCGIKGQYLIFEDQKVMNMRRHAGYMIEVEY
ncbi:MAG: DUF2797 domain-containing protein [Marinifilaceae bacterium]